MKPYQDGLKDGLAWDLDGFSDAEAVKRERQGWDDAAINAIGSSKCAEKWGVATEGEAWEHACAEYNRGAYEGACAPQEERTGLPPRS